jgi:cytochrome c peroxidase
VSDRKTIRADSSITGAESDRGAFKTPGLHNVELHAPYMHDGSLPTLRAVIDYYDRGGGPRPGKSPFLMKIGLTEAEKRDLVSFLLSLTDTPAARTR